MMKRQMPSFFKNTITLACLCGLVVLVAACGSQEPTAQAVKTGAEPDGRSDSASANLSPGYELFVSKGCAACHGQNGEGTSIAPGLPGHNAEMVIRQVRNPRFQMPVFSTAQISDEELDQIASYISGLKGQEHLHLEASNLSAAVEMHHWMALESLKVDDSAEAIHHVSHIIELLEPGNHRETMQTILNGLEQGGETHGQEHDIEEMLAGSGSPELTLTQLHLRQALISLAAGDVEESKHHVTHAQEHAGGELASGLAEVLQSLESNDLHALEHGLQELLGQEEDHD